MTRECQSCGSRFCDGIACYLEEPETSIELFRAAVERLTEVHSDPLVHLEPKRRTA